jgi:NAD+ diphosphatase
MPFALFDAPETEASRFVAFAGNALERESEKRADDSVAAALREPSVRLLLIGGGRLLMKPACAAFEPYFTPREAGALGLDPQAAILLGRSPEGPVLALAQALDPEALPAPIKAIDHRSLFIQDLLVPDLLGQVAQGASLLAWHATHRFCGRCGRETGMRAGGYRRHCGGCGADHFPRTDPVVIMLTVRGDKCLLGRSRHFAPGMYSTLAGFVEPGETIEDAVRRETLEESGIRLGRVVYHASQPWPFPHSLMIGCFGEALGDRIAFDGDELEDCRWFSRDDLRSMLADTHPEGLKTPKPGAIAHHLIRAWMESA